MSAPSTLSRSIARTIKADFAARQSAASETPLPSTQWYKRPQHVDYRSIACRGRGTEHGGHWTFASS